MRRSRLRYSFLLPVYAAMPRSLPLILLGGIPAAAPKSSAGGGSSRESTIGPVATTSSPSGPARPQFGSDADYTPDPQRWRAFSVCLVVGFMSLLDVSIVNVALPSIQK